jgi:hypothetical protein
MPSFFGPGFVRPVWPGPNDQLYSRGRWCSLGRVTSSSSASSTTSHIAAEDALQPQGSAPQGHPGGHIYILVARYYAAHGGQGSASGSEGTATVGDRVDGWERGSAGAGCRSSRRAVILDVVGGHDCGGWKIAISIDLSFLPPPSTPTGGPT